MASERALSLATIETPFFGLKFPGYIDPRVAYWHLGMHMNMDITRFLVEGREEQYLRHFHFYGKVPLALVEGRERTYFEHFWNDFASDPKHSVPEADRIIYAKAYAQTGGMRAGFEYFRNFERDAEDFAQLSATRLPMPVLVLTGEKASGNFLIAQAMMVASDVRGQVVLGSGHWLMEEAPQAVIPAIVDFIN